MMTGQGTESVPRLGRRSVGRPRLVPLFDRIAETGILLVSAGAGYGKTTALSSWASGLDGLVVAWIDCRDVHNDPRRLTEQVGSAFREATSTAELAGLGDIASAVGASVATHVVVFDDAHRLTDPSVWTAVEDLIERRPHNLRIVVSGRDEEGLPWHRLRARGEVTEIHEADLCFTRAEVAALLTETYGIDDPDDVVGALLAATQGWAVGLCLAGHALRAGTTQIDRLALGRHRDLRGYFENELLAGLEPDHVRFLEITSILERLDPGLCDLLTGRSDSHAVLEGFVDRNLFTEQISTVPPVFGYHQLFAEYLRARARRFDPSTIVEGLAVASCWYAEHELPDLAIDAALRSGDVQRVESLIRAASGPMLRAGFPHTVARWVSALPLESLDAHPDLALLLARSAGATGDLLTARAGLASVGSHIRTAIPPTPPSIRLAYHGLGFSVAIWTGDLAAAKTELEQAEAVAEVQRDGLGPDMFGFGTVDLAAFRALWSLLHGDLDDAIRQVERSLTPGQLAHPGKEAMLEVGVRALAMAWRDDAPAAREAIELSRAAVAAFDGRTGGLLSFHVAGAWSADLDDAESHLRRARSITTGAPLPVYRLVHRLAEARLALRTGRWKAAVTSLDEARDILATMPSFPFLAAIEDDLRTQVLAVASEDVEVTLSERERAVLSEIAAGASRREAAAHLYLSVNTVKTYLRSAYAKLGATNRMEAIERADELGVLDRSGG